MTTRRNTERDETVPRNRMALVCGTQSTTQAVCVRYRSTARGRRTRGITPAGREGSKPVLTAAARWANTSLSDRRQRVQALSDTPLGEPSGIAFRTAQASQASCSGASHPKRARIPISLTELPYNSGKNTNRPGVSVDGRRSPGRFLGCRAYPARCRSRERNSHPVSSSIPSFGDTL
jgi:hypothetical protein